MVRGRAGAAGALARGVVVLGFTAVCDRARGREFLVAVPFG
jgi:hypothetical protein